VGLQRIISVITLGWLKMSVACGRACGPGWSCASPGWRESEDSGALLYYHLPLLVVSDDNQLADRFTQRRN